MKLIKPTESLERQYQEFHDDWIKSGEKLIPFVLKFYNGDLKEYVEKVVGFSRGEGVGEKFVAHSTFWLVLEDDSIVGTANIRHMLNERLLKDGGHIGYGIRPSFRKKGYGKIILREGLKEAAKIGITKALLTCDQDNIGSAKIITGNGGVFDSEELIDGKMISRYWINIV